MYLWRLLCNFSLVSGAIAFPYGNHLYTVRECRDNLTDEKLCQGAGYPGLYGLEQAGDEQYDEYGGGIGYHTALDLDKRRFKFSHQKREPYSFGIGKRTILGGIMERYPEKHVPYHIGRV